MLFQKVNLISTYSAGNAVSKGKLDICESADSGAKNSLGDAKIFFNFGCPKGGGINFCVRGTNEPGLSRNQFPLIPES